MCGAKHGTFDTLVRVDANKTKASIRFVRFGDPDGNETPKRSKKASNSNLLIVAK